MRRPSTPLRRTLLVSVLLTLLLAVLPASANPFAKASRRGNAAVLAAPDAGGVDLELSAQDDGTADVEASAAVAVAGAEEPAVSAAWAKGALECFQVAQPVLGESGPIPQSPAGGTPQTAAKASCSRVLMVHSFAWSYGMPFVGNYTPPDCDFNRVVINFTVVSSGRQFDRLALMYLGDTEVWRTSTAEPRQPPGIAWTYWKDMTQFLYFWKRPQTVIFDLGNLIDDKYTGPFNTTLTATFFKSDVETDAAPPADLIIPISARNSSAGAVSAWQVPAQTASNTIDFPRNVRRAVFSVSANGQSNEEFWWGNVLESDAEFSPDGRLPGFSPFREVQVLIDGRLAGVQWPFPVIFTGGISPTFHRPVVGIDAFDLREHEIDITPWLPLLCDGKQHTFAIRVGGVDDTGAEPFVTSKVLDYWVVTGKIFVWLDEEGSVTTGEAPTVVVPEPAIFLTHSTGKNSTGGNETLKYSIQVRRSVSVTGSIKTAKGTSKPTWLQTLSYSNVGDMVNYGNDGVNNMTITGMDEAAGAASYRTAYSYPLWVNSSYRVDRTGAFTIRANLNQGLRLEVEGAGVFPTGLEAYQALPRTSRARFGASRLSTFREGEAYFFQTADGRSGSANGSTRQEFTFGGVSRAGMLGDAPDVTLYRRELSVVNDAVIKDKEVLADVGSPEVAAAPAAVPAAADVGSDFAPMLGHAEGGVRGFFSRAPESQLAERDEAATAAEGVRGQRMLG